MTSLAKSLRAVSQLVVPIVAVLALSSHGFGAGTDETIGWGFGYDNKDRLATIKDPAGRATNLTYEYHDNGRVRAVVKNLPSGSTVRYEFDRFGRLVSMKDTLGASQYSYDGFNRLTQVERSGDPAIKYEYDTQNRVIKLQVGDQWTLGYEYDFLGRLAILKTPAGNIEYKHWPGKASTERILPNGVWTRYEYLPDGKLKTIIHAGKDGRVLAKFEYTYRPDGLISEVTESQPPGQKKISYDYDNVGRLVTVRSSDGESVRYEYDKLGNRIGFTQGDRKLVGSYDWAGRIMRYGDEEFEHDACGNLSKRRGPGGSGTEYTYTEENLLSEVKRPDATVTYQYDGQGQLIERRVGNQVARFVPTPFSDIWRPLVSTEADGASKLFLWHNQLLGCITASGVEFYLQDHLGSVRLVVDNSGKILARSDYSCFGEYTQIQGQSVPKVGFAGLSYDANAHLWLTQARAYDHALGRFLQREPKQRPRSGLLSDFLPYAYCANDPVNYADRDGRQSLAVKNQAMRDHQRLYGIWQYKSAFRDFGNFAGAIPGSPIQQASFAEAARAVLSTLVGAEKPLTSVSYGSLNRSSDKGSSQVTYEITTLINPRASGGRTDVFAKALDVAAGYFPDNPRNTVTQLAKQISNAWDFTKPVEMPTSAQTIHEHSHSVSWTGGPPGSIAPSGLSPGVSVNPATRPGYIAPPGSIVPVTPANLSGPDNIRSLSVGEFWRAGEGAAGYQAARGMIKVANQGIMGSRVGGVYLRSAGQGLQGLGRLNGLALDEANGRLVLLGEKTDAKIALPPLALDDVVTIFRSVYDHGMAPYVSIDPNPADPKGPIQFTRFGPEMTDTYVGWILFEADRIMKGVGAGKDNITGKPIKTKVPGYSKVLDERFTWEKGRKEAVWERFWIVPAEVRKRHAEADRLTLFDVPLRVNTERMELKDGKLVTAEDKTPTKGAQAFTAWFTARYNELAEEVKMPAPEGAGRVGHSFVYRELERIALITAIAEQLRDQGVPMPQWMREYKVKLCKTPKTTPAITVERTKATSRVSIYGGVQLAAEDRVVRSVSEDRVALQTATEVRAALPIEPEPKVTPIKGGNGNYVAAAIPGPDTVDVGALELTRLDLSLPVGENSTLEVVRRYSSFCNPEGEFGLAWTLNLPRLLEQRIPTQRSDGATKLMIGHVLVDPLGSLNTPLFEIKPLPDGQGRTVATKLPAGILAFAKSDESRAKTSVSQVVFADGKRWHFDKNGHLVAVSRGPFTTVYVREAGLVLSMEGWRSDKKCAEILLQYDKKGRITKANSSDGKSVSYSYDDENRLVSVQGPEGEAKYGYKESLLTALTENGRSVGLVYDDRGRLQKETDASGTALLVREISRDRDGAKVVLKSTASDGSPEVTQIIYDRQFRPVNEKYPDGSHVDWTYSANGSETSVQHCTAQRDEYRIELDAAAKMLSFHRPEGGLYSIKGESKNRSGLWLGEKRAGTITSLADGRVESIETESSGFHVEYDKNSSVSRVLLPPPVPGPSFDRWSEVKFDQEGRLAQTRDYTGGAVEIDYDSSGEPKRIRSPQGWMQTDRDQKNRPVKISSSWGASETFAYDDAAGTVEHNKSEQGRPSIVTKFGPNGLLEFRNFDGGLMKRSYHDKGAAKGQLSNVRTENDLLISHDYDSAGRLSAVKVGEHYRLAYEYDEKGLLVRCVQTPIAKPGALNR
jgi:RHS repeat-associated protein